jgi:hypothetical protein
MAVRLIALVTGAALLGLGIGLAGAVPGPGFVAGIGAGLVLAASTCGTPRPAGPDA